MGNRLTEKQMKLVEDNHDLIYAYLSRNHLDRDSTEDWYGTAAVGLCKAALDFDESRGLQFSTVAFAYMRNEVFIKMRSLKKEVQALTILDEPPYDEDGDSNFEYIPSSFNTEHEALLSIALEEIQSTWSERDKQILEMLVNQTRIEDIEKEFGLSHGTVCGIKKRFRDMIAGSDED